MKKILSSFLIVIFLICGCKTLTPVTINGNVTNLPQGSTIYLMKQGTDDVIIDSSLVLNNTFSFTLKTDKKYVPKKVKLKVGCPKIRNCNYPVFLYNNKQPIDSLHAIGNLFYAEKGKTFISGDFKNDPYLLIQSGKENDFMFKEINTDPPEINEYMEENERAKIFNSIKTFVKQDPSSFFIFDKIFRSRTYYSREELKELIALFNKNILKTANGNEFKRYFKKMQNDTLNYSNYQFADSSGNFASVVDRDARVIIISFWASWCGPCRAEIPSFKSLYEKYKIKGLEIVSISIDNSKDDWKLALLSEKMPWKQLRFPDSEHKNFVNLFDVHLIPTTIILSNDYKKIKRITGYDAKDEPALDSLLSKLINK